MTEIMILGVLFGHLSMRKHCITIQNGIFLLKLFLVILNGLQNISTHQSHLNVKVRG